jgi:hypothetical protein
MEVCFVGNDCAEWGRFLARTSATFAITVASGISGGTGFTVTFSSIPTNLAPDTIMQVLVAIGCGHCAAREQPQTAELPSHRTTRKCLSTKGRVRPATGKGEFE